MNHLLPSDLQQLQIRFENYLDDILPNDNTLPKILHKALRYSCLNGGKRIRPLLVYITGHALNIDLNKLDHIACAIELIHCYSLVHDDLPAMDDDDLRRGEPSCHVKFDEGTAILVGDALQSLSFEILLSNNSLPVNKQLQIAQILTKACGCQGMAGGQSLDLLATNKRLTLDELTTIHELKTQALLISAVKMAIIAADNPSKLQINALNTFATNIGLAFQIHDDLLDCLYTTEQLGKPANSDKNSNKSTFFNLLGQEKATIKIN